MTSLLLRLALVLLLGYGAILLLLFLLQGRILFQATRDIYRDPSAKGWTFEEVNLPVDGHTTHGWYVPLENARGVALFSHGNAGNIADRLESIGLLRSFGLSVLAYDYGGYGKSTGGASEKRCYADIRAMWRYLTETKGIPANQVLLFGRSLGAAVTIDLAQEVQPVAVIIESAFLSTGDIAAELYPWLPARWFMRYRFENKKKIANIHDPLLLIHSPDDEIIPYPHGQELFRLANEPKQFLQINGSHNTGFVESDRVYREGWEGFLEFCLPVGHIGSPATVSGVLDTQTE